MPPTLWIVVLIKDFRTAKSRLSPAMEPAQRRALAELTAARALDAALAVAPTLAVCGSEEAAVLARGHGATVLLEPEPGGQNPAARRGLDEVARRGAESALVMSSDLPLVDADGLRRMLAHGDETGAIAVAASATGRQGTNALFLRPPGDFDLHFGAASLPRFAQEAMLRGRRFTVHDDPTLALDLDEPSDLSAWRELEPTA
jgi:2-phospho-L-lactate/phosphoenolpyruvate guanylyltransferase